MYALRSLSIGTVSVALVIVALGAPAAAADTKGTLAIVNGYPGHKVDVCLNGKELKSKLPYGRVILKDVVATGAKHLRFYRPDSRRCQGQLVAKKHFDLGPGDDLTIVVTKNAPRVLIFDNVGLGEIPPLGAPYTTFGTLAWCHAAEFGVNFKSQVWAPNPEQFVPLAAAPVWTKGHQVVTTPSANTIWQLRATLPESPDTIALKRTLIEASHRYQWIFVGSTPANARFVFLDRLVSFPSA